MIAGVAFHCYKSFESRWHVQEHVIARKGRVEGSDDVLDQPVIVNVLIYHVTMKTGCLSMFVDSLLQTRKN